ncbi:MAG TPA: hypothetical protein VHD90_15025 [Phototrophicaceae bacterium]|nr:hypothetical protein [Phototrophicaceae bacterium]
MTDEFLDYLRFAQKRVEDTRNALEALNSETLTVTVKKKKVTPDDVYRALSQVGEPLAKSYLQVKNDVESSDRTSWAGTAHEIREILATLLRTLAPDDEVTSSGWYKEEKDPPEEKKKRITQKQRVIYILKQHEVGSAEEKVVKDIGTLDEMIGSLIRDTYTRASAAAHTFGGQKEAKKLLKYFEAFAYNLMNLD